MPYFVIKARFPRTKGNEVAKIYIEERKKYPFDRSLGKEAVLAATTDEKSVLTIGVLEIKEGKLEEVIARENKISMMYLDIEGYNRWTEMWMTAVETLGLLGLKAPE